MGAIRNNNLGCAGIAGGNGALSQYGAELYSMKILYNKTKCCKGNVKQVLIKMTTAADAIVEGATNRVGYGYALDIMNHSWQTGTKKNPPVLMDAVRYAYQNQVVFTAMAGNTGNNKKQWPSSNYDKWVIKVGANKEDGTRWPSSTTGNNIDFIAPGTSNLLQGAFGSNNSAYTTDNGTSFAAPHVAGVCALMNSYIKSNALSPNLLSPEDYEHLLQRYSDDKGPTSGYDDFTGWGKVNAGNTLQGMKLPRYEVMHYGESVVTASAAVKIGTNTAITLLDDRDGLISGTYIGDIWVISQTFNITQPSGRTILDVWARNSNSIYCSSSPFIAEAGCIVNSWNQTQATMLGFVYELKTDVTGSVVNKWMPGTGLNGWGRMELTVYSEDPLATDIHSPSNNRNLVRLYPNPSHGDFTLAFGLNKNGIVAVEVTDLAGKVVYAMPMQAEMEGHKEIALHLPQFSAGVYFVTLVTSYGSLTQKLIVNK